MRAAALVLLTLVASVSCTPTKPVVLEAREYALADYGYTLRLPAGWQVFEHEGALRWQARPVIDGQPVAGVYFTVDRDAARAAPEGFPVAELPTLASYAARSEALAAKDSRRYRVVDSGQFSLDGVEAAWRERAYASYTMARRSYAVMAVRGPYGYLLVGAAAEGDYVRWAPAFRAIAASLRWTIREP